MISVKSIIRELEDDFEFESHEATDYPVSTYQELHIQLKAGIIEVLWGNKDDEYLKKLIQKVGDEKFPGQIDDEEVGYIFENIKSMDMEVVNSLKGFTISNEGNVRIGYAVKELSKDVVFPRVKELVDTYAQEEDANEQPAVERKFAQPSNERTAKKYAFGHEVKQGISSKELTSIFSKSHSDEDRLRIERLHKVIGTKENQINQQKAAGLNPITVVPTSYGLCIGDKNMSVTITPKFIFKLVAAENNANAKNLVTVYKKGSENKESFQNLLKQVLPNTEHFQQVYQNIVKAFDLRRKID